MQAFLIDAAQLQYLTDIKEIDNRLTGTVNVGGDPDKVVNIGRLVSNGVINTGLMQLTDIGRIRNGVTGAVNIGGNPDKVVNIASITSDGTINTGLMQLTEIDLILN